jgi:hypothetical protein
MKMAIESNRLTGWQRLGTAALLALAGLWAAGPGPALASEADLLVPALSGPQNQLLMGGLVV